jgi:hypothetical protein
VAVGQRGKRRIVREGSGSGAKVADAMAHLTHLVRACVVKGGWAKEEPSHIEEYASGEAPNRAS